MNHESRCGKEAFGQALQVLLRALGRNGAILKVDSPWGMGTAKVPPSWFWAPPRKYKVLTPQPFHWKEQRWDEELLGLG